MYRGKPECQACEGGREDVMIQDDVGATDSRQHSESRLPELPADFLTDES